MLLDANLTSFCSNVIGSSWPHVACNSFAVPIWMLDAGYHRSLTSSEARHKWCQVTLPIRLASRASMLRILCVVAIQRSNCRIQSVQRVVREFAFRYSYSYVVLRDKFSNTKSGTLCCRSVDIDSIVIFDKLLLNDSTYKKATALLRQTTTPDAT